MNWRKQLSRLVGEIQFKKAGSVLLAIGLLYLVMTFLLVLMAMIFEPQCGFHSGDLILLPAKMFGVSVLGSGAIYGLGLIIVGVFLMLGRLHSYMRLKR